MRVTTYSQRSANTHVPLLAILLFTLTIVQGTSTSLVLMQYFAPQLQALETLLWLASYFIAICSLMLRHGIGWVFWISRYRFLLLVLLLGTLASVMWSIDSGVSLQRAVHLLGSCILAIYFGFMLPLSIILSVLSGVLAVLLFASITAVFALPDLGVESYEGIRVWKGVTTSKNTLGFWAAISVLLYISQMARPIPLLRKAAYFALVLISLAVLYFSHSVTSQLALITGGAVALYFFLAIRFHLGFFRMVLMAIFFIAVVALAIANIDTSEVVGRSGDLTGRGEVWRQTWKLILEKPLTGYGYGSIWNPNDSTLWIQQSLTDFSWVVYHAHNGFLQIASEIGLPLAAIALLMIVQQLIEIFYCQYQRQQAGVLFVLGFVVAYLVSNYSEARFLVNRELYWILFLTLPISMLRQLNVVLSGPDAGSETLQDNDGHVRRDRPWQAGDAHGAVSAHAALTGGRHTSLPTARRTGEDVPVAEAAAEDIGAIALPRVVGKPLNENSAETDNFDLHAANDLGLYEHNDPFDKNFNLDISLDDHDSDDSSAEKNNKP